MLIVGHNKNQNIIDSFEKEVDDSLGTSVARMAPVDGITFIKLFKKIEKFDHLFVGHLQKYVREEMGYKLSLKLDSPTRWNS